MKKITFIVLTCNKLEQTTKPFIESLYKYTDQSDFNLIIIDNGSSDKTVSYIKSLKYNNITTVFNTENLGFSKGMNQGLKLKRNLEQTKYIGLLNNDILFTKDWLVEALKGFEYDHTIGSISPRVNSLSSVYENINSENYLQKYPQYLEKYKEPITYTIKPYYCCAIFKSEVIEQVGLLDENFSPAFYEDDDYSMRILCKGWKNACVNHSFVFHNHCSTSGQLKNKNELIEKNKIYFYKKHYLGKYIHESLSYMNFPYYNKSFYLFLRFLYYILPIKKFRANIRQIAKIYLWRMNIGKNDIITL